MRETGFFISYFIHHFVCQRKGRSVRAILDVAKVVGAFFIEFVVLIRSVKDRLETPNCAGLLAIFIQNSLHEAAKWLFSKPRQASVIFNGDRERERDVDIAYGIEKLVKR